MRVSDKLFIGFSIVSLLAVSIGVTGLFSVHRINQTLIHLSDVAAPTVETSDDLIANSIVAMKTVQEILASKDLARISLLESELGKIKTTFDDSQVELAALVQESEFSQELETARAARIDFESYAKTMIKIRISELEKEALGREVLESFDVAGSELIRVLEAFAVENETEMARAEEEGDRLELAGASGSDVNSVLGELFDQDFPVVEAALKLQRMIIEMQDTAGEYLAEENALKLAPIEMEFDRLHMSAKPHVSILMALAETADERDRVTRIDHMLDEWRNRAVSPGALFELHQSRLATSDEIAVLISEIDKSTNVAVAALERVAEAADAISDGADEAAGGAVENAWSLTVILLLLSVIVTIFMLVFVFSTVVRPIRMLTDEMMSFGQRFGNDRSSTDTMKDEIVALRTAFQQLSFQVDSRTKDLERRTNELDFVNQDLGRELEHRKSLQQQLLEKQKLESLGTLAGGIAHDFNNMLYVILSTTQLTLKSIGESDELAPAMKRIQSAAQRSKSIVDQILYFSRQNTVEDLTEMNLGDAVHETVTLLRAGLPTSMHIDVTTERDDFVILGDRPRIEQVIVNLVTNAYQSYPNRKGGIQIDLRHTVLSATDAQRHPTLQEGSYVQLTVRDNGIGIPKENASKIFDPYFTTKPVGEGTGLGLSVVHGIVSSHDGAVIFEDNDTQGTRACVYLPSIQT